MKKIFSLILSLIIFASTVIYAPKGLCAAKKHPTVIKGKVQKKNITPPQKPKEPEFVVPMVKDELVEKLAPKDIQPIIEYKEELLLDEPIVTHDSNLLTKAGIKRPKLATEQGIEIPIKPVKKIKTKNSYVRIPKGKKTKRYAVTLPCYHEKLMFNITKDIQLKDKTVIPQGSLVQAKVGEISSKAMGGAPAEIVIENFELVQPDGSTVPLTGKISADGYSLSFWVGLAELATTPFLIGLAVPILRVIPGGQAVITPRKTYTIYYQEK